MLITSQEFVFCTVLSLIAHLLILLVKNVWQPVQITTIKSTPQEHVKLVALIMNLLTHYSGSVLLDVPMILFIMVILSHGHVWAHVPLVPSVILSLNNVFMVLEVHQVVPITTTVILPLNYACRCVPWNKISMQIQSLSIARQPAPMDILLIIQLWNVFRPVQHIQAISPT